MAWNSFNTADYEGIMSETIVIDGYNSDKIRVYYSRPMGSGPYPGIVLIPHMPGWDEWLRETCNRFSRHGYAVACPNIYERVGHGTPTEVSAKAR
ncbi:MAG: dienelactone hydrolase family protein, partial [Lachnospiraceae bacterium]|nr:dienelactone hydrolase family protein [Lachnospiraceae bacterium]